MKEKGMPKGYDKKSISEEESISLLNYTLDKKLVASHINSKDKVPNHDGDIELLNTFGQVIGKVTVQVKTLSDKGLLNLGFNCEKELLYAAKRSTNPFLLIGVHQKSSSIYWTHLSKNIVDEKLEELEISGNNSKKIDFPSDNIISKECTLYHGLWINMYEQYLKLINMPDVLTNEEKSQEEIQYLIEEPQSSFLTASQLESTLTFLKSFNSLLCNEYMPIKKRFFRNAEEIGIVLNINENRFLTYAFLPRFHGGAKIIEFKEDQSDYLLMKCGRVSRTGANKFLNETETFARNALDKLTKEYIEDNHYIIYDTGWLIEFVLSFVDENSYSLNLPIKEAYHIDELLLSIEYYHIHEQENQKIFDEKFKKGEFQGNVRGTVSVSFDKSEMALVHKNTLERMNKKEFVSMDDYRDYVNVPIKKFFNALLLLLEKNVSDVTKTTGFQYLNQTDRSNYLLEFIEKNELIFKKALENEFKMLKGKDVNYDLKLFVLVESMENSRSYRPDFYLETYTLICENENDKDSILKKERYLKNNELVKFISFMDDDVTFDGIKFSVIESSTGRGPSVFGATPLNDNLKERLLNFFPSIMV